MALNIKKKSIYFFISFFLAKNSFALESLSYSGRLVQTNGAPVSGTVTIRAELAYTNNLSTVLCSDDVAGVVLSKGVFHVKLDFACTGGKTLTQVLSQAPANESVAIQITDMTNSKSYSFQAIHGVPYANVASIAAQLEQNGAGNGEFLKWDDSTKQWKPGTVSGASGGTVTSVSASGPLSVATPTSTPAISISQANGTTSGYLSSADWNTFNSKEGTIAGGTATQYYRGDKSWQTLDTSVVPENVNLYFTNARVLGVPLTGFATAAGAIVATDTTLAAFEKAQGQINAINSAAANYLIKNSTDTVTGVVNVGTTGLLQLTYAPVGMNDATNKAYVDSEVGNKVSKAGDTITGILTLNSDLKIKGGSNFVTIRGHATSANYNLVLPQTAGTAGYVLTTDGSGNTTWSSPAVGSSTITDGSIVDADVNASAAIAQSKIANLTTDLASKVSTTLSSGNVFVGNGSNVATGVTVSGDATLSNTGVLTFVNSGATAGTYKSVTVDAKGRVTAGTNPTTLAGYGITDTLVTSITVTAPITKTGTASVPILAMPAATTSVDGYLTATDWTTFNNKQAAINSASTVTAGSVTTSLQGGVNLNPFGVAAGNTGEIRFYELAAGGTNYTSLKAPDALGANINYTLPSTAPTAGQVLSSSAAGVMSWTTIPAAPVTTVFGRSGAVAATAGDYTAAQVSYSPAGNIAATTVQAALDEIDSEKQGLISAGTTAQYYRGDKTFVDFGTDVRATALTGFAVGANSTVAAADSTLAAFGKVQGQINATNTAVAGKEPAITAGTTAQYIRGDKTLSTFATDAINSVLSTFALNGTSKPAVANTDSIVGAFGKVQKFINDINSDYVSKSANQTINGSLAINSVTGFITVPTPVNPNDAANKSYVDSFGQWTENGSDIYFNTGKVGIGLTAPQQLLHLGGTASSSLAQFTNTATGNTAADGSYVGINSAGNMYVWNQENLPLLFGTNNGERMRIDAVGNVGIGNTTPGYILDIAATTPTVRIKSASNDATGATLKLTEDMIENGGFLRYKSITDTLDLGMIQGGTEIPSMSIVRANGNVGIGTTTPQFPLVITKDQAAATTWAAVTNNNASGATGYLFGNDGASWGVLTMNSSGNASYGGANSLNIINQYNAPITFSTTAERMRITGAGNIGIGVSNPQQKVVVQGGNLALNSISNASPQYEWRASDNSLRAYISHATETAGTGGDENRFFQAYGYKTFYTQGFERMRIDSSGNVGIQTTAPTNPLNVSNSGAFNPAANVNSAIMVGPPSGIAYGGGVLMKDGTNYSGIWTNGNGVQLVIGTGGTTGGFTSSNQIVIGSGNIAAPGCVSYNGGVSGTCLSDRRLKKNIKPFALGLNTVMGIKPVSYKYNGLGENKEDTNARLGVIAQDVEKVAPELVERRMVYMHEGDKEKTEVRAVNYNSFTYMLINSIKELYGKWSSDHDQIEIQKREIASLKAENEELKNRVLKNENQNAEILKRLDRLEKARKK